jgi:hypothetical protein
MRWSKRSHEYFKNTFSAEDDRLYWGEQVHYILTSPNYQQIYADLLFGGNIYNDHWLNRATLVSFCMVLTLFLSRVYWQLEPRNARGGEANAPKED